MSIFQIILSLLVAVTIDKCQGQFDSATLNLVRGATYFNHQSAAIENIDQLGLDPSLITLIHIHGYTDSPYGTIPTVVQSFSGKKEYNLIILDWSALARGDYYTSAISNCILIGTRLGRALLTNFQNGKMDPKKVYIVGHSLGAQMAGVVGRATKPYSVSRITGLDPAGPGFTRFTGGHETLSKNDADFVDIIHTNAGGFGISSSTGHVDFWPNGGRNQPACGGNTLCSHVMAVTYFTQSVSSNSASPFPASPGRSGFGFPTGSTVSMGIKCPPTASGDYHLTTSRVTNPFTFGSNGLGSSPFFG